ncbi:MAG: hypothetical protein ABGZ35_02055 [Planctomycetaceae bacterium]|jgi:hypothetical protein
MNARVLLLLLITGLFMAAWNGDQTAKQRFLALQSQQRDAMSLASVAGLVPARGPSTESQRTGPIPTSVQINRHVVSQFRPDGIGAGTYRAVSETGVTFELTVDNNQGVAERDFYVADAPTGTRWYFVRVSTSN